MVPFLCYNEYGDNMFNIYNLLISLICGIICGFIGNKYMKLKISIFLTLIFGIIGGVLGGLLYSSGILTMPSLGILAPILLSLAGAFLFIIIANKLIK